MEVFVTPKVMQIESPTWPKLHRHQLPAPVPQAPHHPAVDNLAPLEPVRATRVVEHRIRRLRDEVAARMPAEEAAAAARHRSTFAPRDHALEPPLPVLRGSAGTNTVSSESITDCSPFPQRGPMARPSSAVPARRRLGILTCAALLTADLGLGLTVAFGARRACGRPGTSRSGRNRDISTSPHEPQRARRLVRPRDGATPTHSSRGVRMANRGHLGAAPSPRAACRSRLGVAVLPHRGVAVAAVAASVVAAVALFAVLLLSSSILVAAERLGLRDVGGESGSERGREARGGEQRASGLERAWRHPTCKLASGCCPCD